MTLLCNRSYTTSGMPARTVHDCALNDSLLASIICMRMDIAKPCLLQHVGVSRPALEGNPRAIARSTVIDCRNFSLLHLCVIHRRVCCTCVWFTGVSELVLGGRDKHGTLKEVRRARERIEVLTCAWKQCFQEAFLSSWITRSGKRASKIYQDAHNFILLASCDA